MTEPYNDPWLMLPSSEEEAETVAQDALQIETIENVQPLDRQFGIHPKKSVPDVLHDALFGQPEPTEAEIAAMGDDASAVPPLQTYAILDAAKVINLPELLGASQLEHRCLFKGAAYDELKNVAPWIVWLEDGNDFTRRLFTGPEGINGLWETEPGIYVRSRATLNEMWRHFRKFTRIQDENGKWFYFRFWERTVFLSLIYNQKMVLNKKFFDAMKIFPARFISIDSIERKAFLISDESGRKAARIELTRDLLLCLNQQTEQQKSRQEITNLLNRLPQGLIIKDKNDLKIEKLRRQIIGLGFKNVDQRVEAMELYFLMAKNGQAEFARSILNKVEAGPAIRLWHLKKALQNEAG